MFYLTNARWLFATLLLTFLSGFGQTFFIALFAGEIREAFALSHGDWGQIYALGTLSSALLMLFLGKYVDTLSAKRITLFVLIGFAVSALFMAWVSVVWLLPVVIFGLRFCGQGMLSHLSVVFCGRWFARNRGKSLAVSGLGFTIAEAIMPIIFVSIMLMVGWQQSWYVAIGVLVVLGGVVLWLLSKERVAQSTAEAGKPPAGMDGIHWTPKMLWKSPVFWLALFALMPQPVFGTTFFFQIVHLTEVKGWALSSFTALLPFYSLVSLVTMFAMGSLLDRYGVSTFLPFYLLPMAFGLIILSPADQFWQAAVVLVLMGISHGCGATLVGAFWAEFFGTNHLGAIRAVAQAIMVFASALGPLSSGMLIDLGIAYESQMWGMSGLTVLACGSFGIMVMISRGRLRHDA